MILRGLLHCAIKETAPLGVLPGGPLYPDVIQDIRSRDGNQEPSANSYRLQLYRMLWIELSG
jgi:hypothetical protein